MIRGDPSPLVVHDQDDASGGPKSACGRFCRLKRNRKMLQGGPGEMYSSAIASVTRGIVALESQARADFMYSPGYVNAIKRPLAITETHNATETAAVTVPNTGEGAEKATLRWTVYWKRMATSSASILNRKLELLTYMFGLLEKIRGPEISTAASPPKVRAQGPGTIARAPDAATRFPSDSGPP